MYAVLFFGTLQDGEFWFADDAGGAATIIAPDEKVTLGAVIERVSSKYVIPRIKPYAHSMRKYLSLPFAWFSDMNTGCKHRRVKSVDFVYLKPTPRRVSAWWIHGCLLYLTQSVERM